MGNKTIAVGCDHGGYELKLALIPALREDGWEILDLGCDSAASCDYPDFAHLVCEAVTDGRAERGILLCGTGIGMSMAANKHDGIRAACVSDTFSARMTREHNDANILCMGGRVVGPGLALDIARLFLETPFSGEEKHARRIGKIMAVEKK